MVVSGFITSCKFVLMSFKRQKITGTFYSHSIVHQYKPMGLRFRKELLIHHQKSEYVYTRPHRVFPPILSSLELHLISWYFASKELQAIVFEAF